MDFVTVYGKLNRWKIHTPSRTIILSNDSLGKMTGWFLLCKRDNEYHLTRLLKRDCAEVYNGWIDELVDS